MTRTIRHWVGRTLGLAALLVPVLAPSTAAIACAVMLVASGDTNVAPQSAPLASGNSKVVLAWDLNHGMYEVALTITLNYHGGPQEFAAVIPVPSFIERKQIGLVDIAAINTLDSQTEPRWTGEYDRDPCPSPRTATTAGTEQSTAGARPPAAIAGARPAVVIEANYEVGEYDISILSATENKSLLEWLNGHGYKLPAGAAAILSDYIGQGMRFFVAKVNLQRMPLLAGQFLRPLQVRYQARHIMLPIRLGMANATGPQELVIFTLSRYGQAEVANYPTAEMPSGIHLPVSVRTDFRLFYNTVFDRVVAREMAAAYVEAALQLKNSYMGGDTYYNGYLPESQLIKLGAHWIERGQVDRSSVRPEVYLTRLHIRYDAAHFPEDLTFKETAKPDFRVNYFLRFPWDGKSDCAAAQAYRKSLPGRFAQEARDLAKLTGWPEDEIRAGMAATGESIPK